MAQMVSSRGKIAVQHTKPHALTEKTVAAADKVTKRNSLRSFASGSL